MAAGTEPRLVPPPAGPGPAGPRATFFPGPGQPVAGARPVGPDLPPPPPTAPWAQPGVR
jgi:hypothetical protein